MTTEESGVPQSACWKRWGVAFALVAATIAVYLPVLECGFVDYGDPDCVVRPGLIGNALAAAFTSAPQGFWQPLTVLSHAMDSLWFGLNASARHAVNLALHGINVFLLFGLLSKMTGSVWRSGFVAALFALHPMNVETVAWIAERETLLCAFFWLLALWAYAAYAARPSPWRYLAMAGLVLCAMMSKPVAVTLPFVLLLLDYWPLKRMSTASFGKLVLEKTPLFVLSLGVSWITFRTQSAAGAIVGGANYSLIDRLSYAVVHYVLYIDKAIWPSDLAVLYPMWTTPVSLRSLLICVALLVFVSVVVLRRIGRLPYLAVGWLWYLGVMLPMIGIVLVGWHSMADRFVYIPFIGFFVMVSWGMTDFILEGERFRRLAVVLAGIALLALGWTSRVQAGYWRDSLSLFRHATEVTFGNYIMHEKLGEELARAGRTDEAIAQYFKAIRINNRHLPARVNLARLLFLQGRKVEAFALQTESIGLFPHDARLMCDAGVMLADSGRRGQAVAYLMQALWLDPGLAEAHVRLGALLAAGGKTDEAVSHLEAAVRLMPESVQARNLLVQVTAAREKAKKR